MVWPCLYVDGQRTEFRVCIASSFGSRALGMLRSEGWRRFEVLHLPRCSAVHTCFVPMPIDVIFADRTGRVLKVVASLAPWRIARLSQAQSVWELPAGVAKRCAIEPGVRLQAWLT